MGYGEAPGSKGCIDLADQNASPSLSKRSKSEVKHKVMHHYILKATALKEKGRPSRLKTE